MKPVILILLTSVLLMGCSRMDKLAHYEGHWVLEDSFINQGEAKSNIPSEVREKLSAYYGLSQLEWHIVNGGIYTQSAGSESRTQIVKEIYEENLNFAEVLVDFPVYGHFIMKIQLRDDYLEVYTNPHRFLFLRFARSKIDETNQSVVATPTAAR